MKFPPCVLCWYQRIAMFPMAIQLAFFWHYSERRAWIYSLPLSLAGLLIAIYQNLLYFKIIPETLTPCTQGVSCSARQIEWFGLITIPLLAFGGFLLITICLLMSRFAKPNLQEDQ